MITSISHTDHGQPVQCPRAALHPRQEQAKRDRDRGPGAGEDPYDQAGLSRLQDSSTGKAGLPF